MLNNLNEFPTNFSNQLQPNLPPKLQILNLSLSVGQRQLIFNLNWQVNAGECWCIIGRNGVGKTTLLRSMAGLTNLDAGAEEILIDNRSLATWSLSELAKIRSYLPQERIDAFAWRVIETVLGARHPYHNGRYWESAEDLAAAHSALAELDVLDLVERDVRSLSGGERQRVAIAAVLAQDAQIMLLDEPTRSLDLAHQISAMQLFSNRARSENKAVVMVSHELNLAYSIATHVLLLMGDGTWKTGPASEIMTQPALMSHCLGHPVEIIWHDKQCIFLPVQNKAART